MTKSQLPAPPMATLRMKCYNCLGSGTVFPGKTFRAKSKQCPVCKGECTVPYTLKGSSQ